MMGYRMKKEKVTPHQLVGRRGDGRWGAVKKGNSRLRR